MTLYGDAESLVRAGCPVPNTEINTVTAAAAAAAAASSGASRYTRKFEPECRTEHWTEGL